MHPHLHTRVTRHCTEVECTICGEREYVAGSSVWSGTGNMQYLNGRTDDPPDEKQNEANREGHDATYNGYFFHYRGYPAPPAGWAKAHGHFGDPAKLPANLRLAMYGGDGADAKPDTKPDAKPSTSLSAGASSSSDPLAPSLAPAASSADDAEMEAEESWGALQDVKPAPPSAAGPSKPSGWDSADVIDLDEMDD